jgi:radical SAM superfamily enzyme YgiQ (UPF0313 family)
MELPFRKRDDALLPAGALREGMERLSTHAGVDDLRVGIVNAFDFRTRMLPYWYADKRMAPCSVRTLADVLGASGFQRVRTILQQWTPNFSPREAELHGKPLDLLMISAMQVHAEAAYDLIRDARKLGDQRPLILAGGAKGIYEPTDFLQLGGQREDGADCVVTGEVYVLVDLLNTLMSMKREDETLRQAFERARHSGALNDVLGLCYMDPDAPADKPVALHTGMQRLVASFDELPMPNMGWRTLEPLHRGRKLKKKPISSWWLKFYSPITSLQVSQGCKFACNFCPIPAVNQRKWRHKSGKRLAKELRHLYETFGFNTFFGTDDNFFNDRDTVIELMTAIHAERLPDGKSLGARIKFFTEATQFDVHKNQDILPICRAGGLRGIWFGIEDLTAGLVKKGQSVSKTRELFDLLLSYKIVPHAMMIHSDDQPLRSPGEELTGVLDQAKFIYDMGAVTYQCTYLGPAVGSKLLEPTLKSGAVYKAVGGKPVPQAHQDGNHVVSSLHPRPWEKQINLIKAYSTFYNPLNFLRNVWNWRKDKNARDHVLFQIVGMIGLVLTIPKMWMWARRLKAGPIEKFDGLLDAPVPMLNAQDRTPMPWSIEFQPHGVTKQAEAPAEPQPVALTVGGAKPEPALSTVEA